MELETYNRKGVHLTHKHNWTKNFLMFLAFIIVVLAILIGTTPLGQNFTGFSVSKNTTSMNYTQISAALSIPKLTLKNEFEEIKIILEKNSTLMIGGQKFHFSDPEKEIILKKFQGTITFDENQIYLLKGKVSEINIGGIKIEKELLEIDLTTNSQYKLISIPKEFSIKNLDYMANGQIKTNRDTISINSEKILITEYTGNLTTQNKQLILNGKIISLEIIGKDRKIKISN